ncbi:hypothetical protein WS67_13820 [Burkholderia singularis]|uniref:Uncharacterized protein n=1 Tax=Burkholderia singularis TaxID=1503053 RepID=A0A103E1L3_9BURK|nr:hypothetical protein WS67_13820 [Burkholderia singularis]
MRDNGMSCGTRSDTPHTLQFNPHTPRRHSHKKSAALDESALFPSIAFNAQSQAARQPMSVAPRCNRAKQTAAA